MKILASAEKATIKPFLDRFWTFWYKLRLKDLLSCHVGLDGITQPLLGKMALTKPFLDRFWIFLVQWTQKDPLSCPVVLNGITQPLWGKMAMTYGSGCPETPLDGQYDDPWQLLLLQLAKKFNPWGCPCSCPTPWCLRCWSSPRWSWLSGNTLKWPL